LASWRLGVHLSFLVCLLNTSIHSADLDRLAACTVMVGGGSGVLVSAEGLVLTNHHVAGDRRHWEVRLSDGRALPARLLGSDPVGDIALLRIEGGGSYPAAQLSTDPEPRPGQAVIAAGNPFGLGDFDDQPTITCGVLSTARAARGSYGDCLVHDAPVNPGNSGGPLFAAGDGRLLGINGQIRSRSGFRANSGIGLAISAAQLALFAPRLEATRSGYVHRTAAPAGLRLEDGPDGPLVAACGPGVLRPGDRLLRVAGRPASSAATAQALFAILPWSAGATVPVQALRAGAEVELAVEAARTPIPGHPRHGLQVAEKTAYLAVTAVEDGSPAASARILAGERVLAVAGVPVRERVDWLRATAGLGVGDLLLLRLAAADGSERTVEVWLDVEGTED
jgi:serine protease Do